VDEHVAGEIFDNIEKFAGYGFNKSHSAAYALVAYQTAWLKAHYPAQFMAAVMSVDMDNTDKIVVFAQECATLGLKLDAPDINLCGYNFVASGETNVRFGLGAIKGVGESAIEAIIHERDASGQFVNLFDFCARVDTHKVNRRVLEALIYSGAVDTLGPSRPILMANLGRAVQIADQQIRDRRLGQNDMFGDVLSNEGDAPSYELCADWPEQVLLEHEKKTLGLYFSGHPLNRYKDELAHITSMSIADIQSATHKSACIAGLITGMRTVNSRKGRMAILTLDDQTAQMEAVLYTDIYQSARALLEAENVLVIRGNLKEDDFNGGVTMIAEHIEDLVMARTRVAKGLMLRVNPQMLKTGFMGDLKRVLNPFTAGPLCVYVDYCGLSSRARIRLGDEWCIQPREELLEHLRALLDGEGSVQLMYP